MLIFHLDIFIINRNIIIVLNTTAKHWNIFTFDKFSIACGLYFPKEQHLYSYSSRLGNTLIPNKLIM